MRELSINDKRLESKSLAELLGTPDNVKLDCFEDGCPNKAVDIDWYHELRVFRGNCDEHRRPPTPAHEPDFCPTCGHDRNW